MKVAVGSIRPRILKVSFSPLRGIWGDRGCSGLDPTEDTERLGLLGILQPGQQGCSGLDPTEDTERGGAGGRPGGSTGLQWARSDRGY